MNSEKQSFEEMTANVHRDSTLTRGSEAGKTGIKKKADDAHDSGDKQRIDSVESHGKWKKNRLKKRS